MIEACRDQEISDRLESLLKDDQKNLGIINTVIGQYEVKAESKPTVQKMIEKATEIDGNSELVKAKFKLTTQITGKIMIRTNTDEIITERRSNNGNGNGVTEFSDRVHWGAIIAGLVIAISSQLLLSAIGAALGFGNIADSGAPRSDSGDVAQSVGVWTIISLFISLFIGGWVTARSFGSVNRSTAALNGAILWATTLAISSFLLAVGVTGAFGLAAANADRIANQAQQSGITIPDARNSIPSGREAPNGGTTPSPIPTLSAQQTREVASNGSKTSWAFIFGSLLGLAAAMAGATVGARSLHTQRNYNGHSQA